MREVIDTNVLLSGLLWRGPPHEVFRHVRAGTLAMVSNPILLAELANVIERPKFDAIFIRANLSRDRALTEIRLLAQLVVSPSLALPICRDPDDDHLLALAVAAKVDLIVTGDDDLLSLGNFADHCARPGRRPPGLNLSSGGAGPRPGRGLLDALSQ